MQQDAGARPKAPLRSLSPSPTQALTSLPPAPRILFMALTIRNPEAERLAQEVAKLTGETATEAVRKALEERKLRLVPRIESPRLAERSDRFWKHLEEDVWPEVPAELRQGISKQEREEILGYGPEGV